MKKFELRKLFHFFVLCSVISLVYIFRVELSTTIINQKTIFEQQLAVLHTRPPIGLRFGSPNDGKPPWQSSKKKLRFETDVDAASHRQDVVNQQPIGTVKNNTKTILLWNGAERPYMSIFGFGETAFKTNACPVNNCMITSNSSLMPVEDFDAILFNVPLLFNLTAANLLPVYRRRQKQRFVYFSVESQFYSNEDMRLYKGYFNWTMSFQNFSDVPLRFGRIEKRKVENGQPQIIGDRFKKTNKTKLIAWFSSHCGTQSQREHYVKAMKKHAPVDVYGLCGDLECEWDEKNGGVSTSACLEMVERDYKFYLSFENSFCNDYVTEKFFSILQYNVVPIVRGLANYSAIAPPHSFINAMDYSSPKDLVDYLLVLDANDTLYNEYFNWKKDYVVHTGFKKMNREGITFVQNLD